MSLLHALPKILEESKEEYEKAKASNFTVREIFSQKNCEAVNILAKGNNLAFMKYLMADKGLSNKLDLIYIDPPFFSQSDYKMNIEFSTGKEKKKVKKKAYTDIWESGMEGYLKMLCTRLLAMKDLLSDNGCLWVHLDWHSVHYVKVLLDEIFGESNFINEVIWQYKSGGTSKRHFSRKHDTLLFYAKNNDYFFSALQEKSYNRGLKPYRFKGVNEYKDELGWHTLVNMKDVWQIDMVGRTAKERTGYATQKPEALLERIIESCTAEGDLCADFFSGSATLATAASKLKRQWICCDMGNLAIINSLSRLADKGVAVTFYEEENEEEVLDTNQNIIIKVRDCSSEKFLSLKEIELVSFSPEATCLEGMNGEDRLTIEQIINEDPLLLVEYWSVDFHYDGFVHRPKEVYRKNKNEIAKKSSGQVSNPGKISIRLVDSFGKSYHKTIDLGEKERANEED